MEYSCVLHATSAHSDSDALPCQPANSLVDISKLPRPMPRGHIDGAASLAAAIARPLTQTAVTSHCRRGSQRCQRRVRGKIPPIQTLPLAGYQWTSGHVTLSTVLVRRPIRGPERPTCAGGDRIARDLYELSKIPSPALAKSYVPELSWSLPDVSR